MKHTYLTQTEISKALETHAITREEADKLTKKMELQTEIYKSTHR